MIAVFLYIKEYTLFSAAGEVVSSGGRVISAPPLLQEANITVITESSKIADMIFFILVFLSLSEIFRGYLEVYKRTLRYLGEFFNIISVIVFELIVSITPSGISLNLGVGHKIGWEIVG